MHLIEIYLPVVAKEGGSISKDIFTSVRRELTEKFGGVTAFMRAPAAGLWQDDDGNVQRDDIVILEVIASTLDHSWWRAYRTDLESRFDQESIIVHAAAIEIL